ncbi:MAG: hypothetical protein JNJ65_12760 [Cyclobacteriaceae bacterium]|nr:hypothetical protein [Cyclobacteriaceae bacterium]
MGFRYNRIVKAFAILLFCAELFVPSVLTAATQPHNQVYTKNQLTETIPTLDLLAHFLFEENTSEEKEGKDDILTTCCCFEVFNQLQKFEIARITWSLPRERFNTQPALYQLHRVLLI